MAGEKLPLCFSKNLTDAKAWYYFISSKEEAEIYAGGAAQSSEDWTKLGELQERNASLTPEEKVDLKQVMSAKPYVR